MSPRKARAIRAVLDLPRLPQQMTQVQRHLYRSAKRRYQEMPAPARGTFLDDVTELKATYAAALARNAEAFSRSGAKPQRMGMDLAAGPDATGTTITS